MASRGVNKVILVGNLGADPEVRTSPNGTVVTNLRLATSEAWKDQQGQLQERTEWHRVVIFGRTAEVARDYLRKGAKVYIEGSLRTSSYEKNGEKRYSTDIVANEMQMLDRSGAGGGQEPTGPRQGGGMGGYNQSAGGGYGAPPPSASAPSYPPSSGGSGGMDVDFDDDIPF